MIFYICFIIFSYVCLGQCCSEETPGPRLLLEKKAFNRGLAYSFRALARYQHAEKHGGTHPPAPPNPSKSCSPLMPKCLVSEPAGLSFLRPPQCICIEASSAGSCAAGVTARYLLPDWVLGTKWSSARSGS